MQDTTLLLGSSGILVREHPMHQTFHPNLHHIVNNAYTLDFETQRTLYTQILYSLSQACCVTSQPSSQNKAQNKKQSQMRPTVWVLGSNEGRQSTKNARANDYYCICNNKKIEQNTNKNAHMQEEMEKQSTGQTTGESTERSWRMRGNTPLTEQFMKQTQYAHTIRMSHVGRRNESDGCQGNLHRRTTGTGMPEATQVNNNITLASSAGPGQSHQPSHLHENLHLHKPCIHITGHAVRQHAGERYQRPCLLANGSHLRKEPGKRWDNNVEETQGQHGPKHGELLKWNILRICQRLDPVIPKR